MSRSTIFLTQIESFLERHKMAPTTFGMRACRDPSFVADLRRGRKPNIDFVEQVLRWMADYDNQIVFEAETQK